MRGPSDLDIYGGNTFPSCESCTLGTTYICDHLVLNLENHIRTILPSLGLGVFAALSVIDGYTTGIGLSRGFRETEALTSFLLNNLGSTGYLEFKVAIAVVAIGAVLVFNRRLKIYGDFAHYLYLTASISLAAIALVPVLNNLLLLGWA